MPPDLVSKEDSNSVGESGVDDSVVSGLKAKARDSGASESGEEGGLTIAIIDGFLLFSEEMKEIRSLFDVRLFLRTDYQTAKTRREARSGYVTLEGFWKDPPHYVDRVVWPNYVKDHAFLFRDENVEGELNAEVCENLGIHAMPREAMGNMTECVKWACGTMEAAVQRIR